MPQSCQNVSRRKFIQEILIYNIPQKKCIYTKLYAYVPNRGLSALLYKDIFETAFIEIEKEVFNSKYNIIIGILYRAPNSSLKTFNEKLEKLLNTLNKEKKYGYLMGDFNVNTKCEIIGTTILTQQFSNIFLSHQFKKLITLSTRE